jgi:hypothetical protein
MDHAGETSWSLIHREGKATRWVGAALCGLTVCAGCILLLEAVCRFGLGLGHPVLVAPDAACEYTFKPDQNLFRDFAHIRINRFAMRSDEIPAQHSPGTLRLMFVGDSITYGTSRVDQCDIFTEILHRELPALVHRPVEVLNASAGGWAIDNELSYVRSRGTFDSDVVVLVLNSGDVWQSRATLAQMGSTHLKNNSMAIVELYNFYIKPRLFREPPRMDAGDFVGYDVEGATRANLLDLEVFQQLVEQRHARMAIVFTPFQGLVYNSGPQAGILRKWCAAHGVSLLDLTPDQVPFTSEQITLDHGLHFNAQGHRVVADAIERHWPKLIGVQ